MDDIQHIDGFMSKNMSLLSINHSKEISNIHMYNSLNINNEFLIHRRYNGITLSKPDHALKPGIRVGHMLNMPFHVYFLNTESIILEINEPTLINCGFNSKKDAIGKTVRVAATKKTAEYEFQHDRSVVEKDSLIIKEEDYQRLKDDAVISGVSMKFPWYNENNKIIGIFGCSWLNVEGSSCKFSEALSLMINAGLLSYCPSSLNATSLEPDYKQKLTAREKEVLHHLVEGKSTKRVAIILGLSPRTVEGYLMNIKSKMGVFSKSELIEKTIHYLKNRS